MVTRSKATSSLNRFLHSRKGTAEVIGSVLFIIIIIFFFTNVYLWHDDAASTMNTLLSDKLNSPVTMTWANTNTLTVMNTGGVNTGLFKLWIINANGEGEHLYVDLENVGNSGEGLMVNAGGAVNITLDTSAPTTHSSSIADSWVGSSHQAVKVEYKPTGSETFKILTTLGNMATPTNSTTGNGGNNGGNGNAPVGAVIIADFTTFNYYNVTKNGNSYLISKAANGYNINSNGGNVAFSVSLTNMDQYHRAITLNTNSQMFFNCINNPTKGGYDVFYIVNVQGTTIQPNYTSITLNYDTPTIVYFASANAVSSSSFKPNDLGVGGFPKNQLPLVYPLNLALLGSFSTGDSFGQNIPFVSVIINN